jgi:hypothetical protein
VKLSLPQRGEIDLRLFDQRGRLVRPWLSGTLGPGMIVESFKAEDGQERALTPGTYYLRVMTPWFSRVEPIDVK